MKLIIILAFLIFLTGCGRDCRSFCPPGQTSNNNLLISTKCHCICDQYHEGQDCRTYKSQKFVGIYTGILITNDSIITQNGISLEPYLSDSSILVVNHEMYVLTADDASSLKVDIRGRNIFMPPTITGSGYLSEDLKRLTLNYTYQDYNAPLIHFTFVGLRQ